MNAVLVADFHARIVRDTFDAGLSEADSLLLFAVLHSYQVEVSGPVLSNCPVVGAGSLIAAITQRHCGEVLSALWPGDLRRDDYMYWYRAWQDWGSYSRFDDLTAAERARMRWLIGQLERHPFVTRLVPEDFDPAATPDAEPNAAVDGGGTTAFPGS